MIPCADFKAEIAVAGSVLEELSIFMVMRELPGPVGMEFRV